MSSGLRKFDYKMFEKARQVAMTSDFKQFNLGCVIAYKGHIVSTGANSTKTHPTQKKYNKKYRNFKKSEKPIKDSTHAEIMALSSIPYPIEQNINWRDVKVYVYRICRGKRLGQGLARPCPACMAALRDKGIHQIYYSTDDGFAVEKLF